MESLVAAVYTYIFLVQMTSLHQEILDQGKGPESVSGALDLSNDNWFVLLYMQQRYNVGQPGRLLKSIPRSHIDRATHLDVQTVNSTNGASAIAHSPELQLLLQLLKAL
jgi:hypothetical protein